MFINHGKKIPKGGFGAKPRPARRPLNTWPSTPINGMAPSCRPARHPDRDGPRRTEPSATDTSAPWDVVGYLAGESD
jgi:hypothetical protein